MSTRLLKAAKELRASRRSLIKSIERLTGRPLITYVAGSRATIDRDDTLGFADLLRKVSRGKDLGLLLHTRGGDIDAAEKLITMVRAKVDTGKLVLVVPDFAKSAGTLMALGSDLILMSDTSELGPIDPQIELGDGKGNWVTHPVQSYLDAYQTHTADLNTNASNEAARLMLGKLDPATVKLCEATRARAIQLAERNLKSGMFSGGTGNFSQAASNLMSTTLWRSHGQMISWKDAKDASIGLAVNYLPPETEEWQRYWRLYCLQRLAIKEDQKLFESSSVFLVA